MSTSPRAVATGLLCMVLALPAMAQHAGHEGHVMPTPAPAKRTAPQTPVAKKAAPRPAVKAPAANRPSPAPTRKPSARAAPKPKPAPKVDVDHVAIGHAPAAAPVHAVDHTGMDHSAMGHDPAPASPALDHSKMDHSKMDHSTMDHSKMDHSTTSDGAAMSPTTPAMDHAAMGHAVPDLPANAAPRTPIPALTDADRAAAFPTTSHGHEAHDQRIHSYWLADRLEWQDTDNGALAWEGLAWIGGDIDRVWLRTEGEAEDGDIGHANAEVLYGRAVTAWWDVVAGVRHDFGEDPSRTWAAFGVQGLAPQKFEVEATAYVGAGGRTAVTLEAEYDTLLTNRLVLQWSAEAELHGRDDPARGIGSGLSTLEAGARLRYEFTRRFAPYVGVEWERGFGRTADFRRADGHALEDTRLVAGNRFWF